MLTQSRNTIRPTAPTKQPITIKHSSYAPPPSNLGYLHVQPLPIQQVAEQHTDQIRLATDIRLHVQHIPIVDAEFESETQNPYLSQRTSLEFDQSESTYCFGSMEKMEIGGQLFCRTIAALMTPDMMSNRTVKRIPSISYLKCIYAKIMPAQLNACVSYFQVRIRIIGARQ